MNVVPWQQLFVVSGPWPWLIVLPCYLIIQLRADQTGRAISGFMAMVALLGFLLAGNRGLSPPRVVSITDAHLGLDAMLLAGLVSLSLRSERLYPLLIAASQLLAVMIDGIVAAGLEVRQSAIVLLLATLAALQFMVLGYGFAAYRDRRPLWRRRSGSENRVQELAPRANDAR